MSRAQPQRERERERERERDQGLDGETKEMKRTYVPRGCNMQKK